MKTNTLNLNLTKKLFCLFVALILTPGLVRATHILGAELTYENLGPNIYKINLNLYFDCSGVAPGTNFPITYTSASLGVNSTMNVSQTGTVTEISSLCPSAAGNSSCNGGVLYGVNRVAYSGIVTLAGPASDWRFSFSSCCRNAAANDLVNANLYSVYVDARLDNLNTPFNNSVQFTADPVAIIYSGRTTLLNWSAWDPDMDSLVFELAPARSNATNPIPYNSGFSYQQPFIPIQPTVMNYATGILSVTPNGIQTNVVCMKVSEYRNGNYVGEVYRDLQIVVINSGNNLPAISGTLPGPPGTLLETSVCAGDTVNFIAVASDIDAGQTISVTMDQSPSQGAFLVGSGPTAQFIWPTVAGDEADHGYTFTLRVDDNACDNFGTQAYAIRVWVNGCAAATDVWPGDANSDGFANLFDLLAVGMAFNDNGPVRPGATLNWTAQPCNDWTNSFPSGVNHKFADTDGNGTVNFADTTAILLNYGNSHPLRVIPASPVGAPDLIVTANYDTVGTSIAVNFDIALGNATVPVDNIYGLAFKLFFDPTLVDTNSITIDFPGSIFGVNGTDMVEIHKDFAGSGHYDIALSRIDMLDIPGSGNVARVTIVTTDNVSGKSALNVIPGDIVATDVSGNALTIDPVGDVVIIDPALTGIPEQQPVTFTLYPVPAHDVLNITFGNVVPERLQLTDLAGRVISEYQPQNTQLTIDTKNIASGCYLVKAIAGSQVTSHKVLIY